MEKSFDCLKMKEEIQAKIDGETKDMTFPELDAYFNKSSHLHRGGWLLRSQKTPCAYPCMVLSASALAKRFSAQQA